jgi:hypothetical protein
VRNPYKEEKIVSEKMYEKSEFDRSLPKKGRLQENKNSWSQSEIEIVRDLLKPFQTWIKAPLEQDPRTIDLLLKMAARYDIPVQHLRGYLDRIWRRLDRMRARPGDIDGWNYIVKAVRQEICAKKSPELEGTRPVTGPGVQSPIGLVDAESPASGCHNDRVDGKRQHFPSERQQLAQSVMDEQRKESERLTEKAHATLGDPNASKEEREFAREMLGLYRPH